MASGGEWSTTCGSVCCALCAFHFGTRHIHPFQRIAEIQEFFISYNDIPLHSCVCKANEEVNLRRGYQGKFKGDFVFRWKKESKKHKVVCCLPSCKQISRRKFTFASVSDIYTAHGVSSVSGSDDNSQTISEDSSVYLCEQHYQCVYNT